MNADDIQWIRVPFSSLREESVLMELHASLQESSSTATVALTSSNNNIATTSTSTCVNGVTMSLEELNQDADVARLQLFARHPHGAVDDAANETSTAKPAKKRAKPSSSAGVNVMSLVLKEPSLLGQSPEAIISTQRQAKKGTLIDRMFQAMDKCILAPGVVPSRTSAVSALPVSASNESELFAPPLVLEPPPSERSSFALKLFSVASCRMQLTLLKSMAPDVRRACVVDLVASILDFPALALANISKQSAEDAMLRAMYSFATDISDDREVLGDGMLLVLALGVSTGQAHFLLHAVSELLRASDEVLAAAESTCAIHYDRLFHRLEMYEPPTTLGVLTRSSLVHQVRIKPMTTDDATPQLANVSIATDGVYLYTWCTSGGLKKIGTGNAGSIAGRIYAHVPATSYVPYFGTKRPVLRAVCGAVEIVSLSSTVLQTAPTVQDAFGGRDGQLLVVFKTGAVLQDILFDALERISLPSTAVVVNAAFGTFVDVTTAIQQLTVHTNGVFTDAVSPLPTAQLLVVLSPLPGESHVRFDIVQKGDTIFKPFPAIESTSVVCVGEWVYLNVTCPATTPATTPNAVEFLQIGTRDLRVKNVISMDTGHRDGVRLQWATEGDYLYDVRFRPADNAVDVHVHDTPSFMLVRSVTVPATAAALFGNTKPHSVPCYTNGRVVVVVAGGVDGASQSFHVDLQRGRSSVGSKQDVSFGAPTAAVCFDAAANMLWSIAPSRHTVECFRNTGTVVYIRDKQTHKAVVSPAQAWTIVRQSTSVGRRWLVGILAKLHEWATCDLKQTGATEGPFLSVDVVEETFQVLIECIASYADRFCRGDDLAGWEQYVLMASLVVLTANVRRLTVKANASIVQLVLNSRLAATLSTLVRFPDMDHPVVQASLHLYKASLDIFYQGPLDQLALVATYLEHLTSDTLHASELPILKLLLQRLTNVETLHDLVKEPKSFDHLDVLLAHTVKWHLMKRDDDDVARELVALVYSMTQSLLWGYHRKRIPEHRAWTCFEAIVQASVNLVQATKSDAIAQLEHSIVGQVCPLLFTAMQHFPWQPAKATYEHMCELLGQLVDIIGPLNKLTNSSECNNETVVETTTKVVKHVESPHDYLNNMHLVKELTIPGASTMTITFDSRSRTEAAYDYVTFYKDDTQTDFYGDEKYSGRGDDHNWPGVDNHPPLVIEAESCHVLFHTDGSGVDWGYKFTVVGLVESQVTYLSLPWLVHVEETLMLLVTSIGTTLVRGKVFSPLSSAETTQTALLNSRLLHGGKQQSSDHVVGFLRDLVDPVDDSTADTVVKELKKRTVQDQGSILHVNRAVRAVAAAILHHNLWGMDVYEIGQAPGAPIAASVLQAWKTAQKMRQWFDIGDAADATVHRASSSGRPTGLKRQPSAYKGQSEEAIIQLCQAVVDRAVFLLEFTPASFSFVRAAKLRWNLLAKYTTAIHRKNSWMHLVNELNAATELKSMLDYRRASMERLKTPKTVTELVLEFVQSDVDVREMQTILETRNDRAGSRVLGMSTIAKALSASSSGRLQHVLLEGMAKTMREIGLEDACSTSLHFFNSLNGCDEVKRKGLSEAVAQCLKACADILGANKQSKWAEESPTASAALVSSALKAMAMDYDVRDSYLLYDSKVLPHILRLLPSDNVRIRRVAQSIIRVLLSHFVAIPDTEEVSTDVPNLSAFQKQLLAAVRLQLEGIVASVQQQGDPHTALCLTRNQAGYCAPFVSVLPNHSLSFWLFVEEQACQYALKVGDEVRRGPHWISSQDDDGGESGVGTIVSIPSPTTVQVKWFATNLTMVYTWDPSLPLYEVQLVDEGVGGMVFLHGNRNLVSDTEEMVAWSHYGLFLTDEGQMKYVVSSGADKDTIFESTDAVHLNAWNHVCVVKEGLNLKLYLNGALDSQHVLEDATNGSAHHHPPSHVLIESVHPCLGHGDVNRWPIAFPGASRLVVTFDPLTQLDKSNGDYICFFASTDETEVWGQSMYNHSFPGVHEESSLIIPADNTVVYFHSSSQTVKWGFRLLVAAEYDDDRQFHDTLNTFPFYFGEPPSRVLDAPSARCWVSHFSVLNAPLKDHEVALHMRLDSQESTPYSFPIDRTLQTLGLIQTCAETRFGRSFITSSVLIRHLMVLAFMGAAETQCGALYVLVDLAPTLSTKLVDDAFQRAFPASASPFLETIWENLGAILNVWPQEQSSVHCHTPVEAQPAALSAMSLVQAYLALIRALAKTREWLDRIHTLLLTTLDQTDSPQDISMVLASVAILGGTYDGVGIGSRVRCCVNIDGKESIEVGSVIQFRLKGESRMACVLFDCDNSRPVDVPISDITVEDDDDDDGESSAASQHLWDADKRPLLLARLERLLQKWHDIETTPASAVTRYKPRAKKQDKVEVLESEHPYANDVDVTYRLDFPGAESILIVFDPLTSTESDCDYIRFRKRDGSGGTYGDDKYSGQHFPGVGSVLPLRIPASSVDVVFHSDSSNTAWGFRLYATSTTESQVDPPEMPPSPSRGVWGDVRARVLKVLSRHARFLAPSWSQTLMGEMARTAVMPYTGRPLTSMPKSQVFESKHPYAHSISEYMAVTFKGANMLTISFDSQSRTEHGCDYVVFFKDKSLGDRWGEHQYTGRAGSENWPGTGGRPPLTIPAEGFTLLWCTDSSNADWGWKFTVKATFPSISPLALSSEQLNQRAYHVTEMLYEQMQYQATPPAIEFDGFERDEYFGTLGAPSSLLLPQPPPPRVKSKWHRIQTFDNVGLYDRPDDKATVVDVLTHNMHVKVLAEQADWFHVEMKGGDVGWVRKRKGDVWIVQPFDLIDSTFDEDTVVLGIDDSSSHLHQQAVLDDSNEEQDELANFSSHFTLEELKGHTHRLHSLAVETYNATAIHSARRSLAAVYATLPPFTSASTTAPVLLDLLVVFLTQQSLSHDDKNKLQSTLYRWIDTSPELLEAIVSHTTATLNHTIHALASHRRAMVRTVESPHPYNDNMDMYWRVDMPGAKYIKVVFDSRSKSEAGCDWLCFYAATDRSITYGEAQYSGRGGTENWPGFGNRPPLIIENDRFEVYFHSDGSGTDWGWAFTAYGIVSDDETSASPQPVDLEKSVVATWLVRALTAIPTKSGAVVDALLNNASVLQTWIDCLVWMPQHIKIEVLGMVTNVALDHSTWGQMAPTHVELWIALRSLVKKRMRSQHKCEERHEVKSPYLQALIQCAMALDHAVESFGFPSIPCAASDTQVVIQKPTTMADSTAGFTADAKAVSVALVANTSVYAWTFEARAVVGAVMLGLRGSDGWNISWATKAKDTATPTTADILVDGTHTIAFGTRDVVRIEVNVAQHLAIVYRNNARLFDEAVPSSLNTLHPLVTLYEPTDIVVVSAAQSRPVLLEFPDPAWYVKAMDSMSALWMEAAAYDSRTRQRRGPFVASRESNHPMAEDAWVDTICIPNATKLEIRFDRKTQLDAKDTIVLHSVHNQSIVLTGLDGKTMADHPAFGPPDVRNSFKAGDVVVRHDRDWAYGDEDGGPGERGVVTEIVSWKHRSGAGVKVKWGHNKHENVYRYGYNGFFDVVLLSTAVQTSPPSVLWIDGDTVQVSVTPFRLASGKESGFRGSLDFNRHTCLVLDNTPHLNLCDDFSIQFWIRLADFKDDKRPQTILFAGHPTSSPIDACLHLSVSSDFKLRLSYKTDDFIDSLVTEPLVPATHTWTHVTITGSGSDVAVYKFGDKWASHTFYGRSSYTTPFHSMYWGHHHPPHAGAGRPGFKPFVGFAGQLYDVQVWDSPLSSTDIRRTLFDKQTRVNDLYPPPPPSYNPWATINNSGKDFTSLRSNICVQRGQAYFEATLLSGGTVLGGWVEAGCSLRRKTAGIGDCASSYAIDINRQYMWHNGPSPFSVPTGVRGNAGDVLGCLLDIDRGIMSYTLNGVAIGDTFTAPKATASPTRTTQRQSSVMKIAPVFSPRNGRSNSLNSTPRSMSRYETKVTELMAMGCSRQKAIEALERNEQSVTRALEWLLHHPEDKGDAGQAVGPPVALVEDAAPVPNQWQVGKGLHPAVSLSPMGAQGVMWNLGQSPFVHSPQGLSSVWSHRQTPPPTDPPHEFQVFDWGEDGWESIKVRHRLLEKMPQLLHRYVLDEGEGVQVEDTKGTAPGMLVSVGATTGGAPPPLKPWKGWIYSPIHNQGASAWGYKFSVFGHFHRDSLPKTRFILPGGYNPLETHRRATLQLVQYVNQKNRTMDAAHVVRATWAEFALRDEDWVRWPLLCEMVSGASPSPDPTHEFNQTKLAQCFKWLQDFNLAVYRLLPLVHFDTSVGAVGAGQFTLSSMISACRGLIFQTLKKGLWEDCLKRTQRSGVSLEMTLNRPKAMRHRDAGLVDTEARTTLFGQAFRQLNSSENHHFRRSDNVYYVKFLGENAEDAGGPYRETFAQYATELHSAQLPMMLRTPNAAHNVGTGREKWVVNPTAFSSMRLRRRMFTFLGKLMGASVRSKDFLAVDMAGLMWKLLVNDEVSVGIDDLEALDKMLVQSMSKMRCIDQLGVTEEMFEDIVLETFTTLSTDNRVVEIKPNGAAIAVTFGSRIEFADLVEHYRLHEFDAVVKYVQEGLAKVLPLNLMSLLTASEFESMVCGSPEVDVDLLAQCTEYSSCAATDAHIVWFWSTLRKFSHEERSAFLRFVWGRSRLPLSVAEFPQWFKLQSFNKSPADTYLPVAHTCFFALELPAYTSEELLMKKLLYAIYNCQEIDADGDSVAANQLGWEE